MNIGFDLDRVFVNYPPFLPASVIDRLYKKKSNGELEYRIPSVLEQKIRQWSHYPLLRPPIKNNIRTVSDMVATHQDHTYYLISSRFGFLDKQTKIIVKKYKLARLFKKLYFNTQNKQPHLFKDALLKNLHINVYIDDDLPLLRYLSVKNPKTQFYWFNAISKEKITNNIRGITDLSQVKI